MNTTLNKKFDKKVTSDEKKKTELPQIEFKNPYRGDLFVTNILLLPDVFFSRKGQVTVKVGDITVLDESDAGTYERNKSIQISLNEEILKRNESIKIWFWNGIDNDTDKITLTALAKISTNPSDTSQASDTWSSDEINRLISESYVDNSTFFLSDILSLKLDDVKSSVDSENVDLQAKIQSLINSLPDSPANEDIIAKLTSVISSVDSENVDLQAKIQSLINSLPDSPANEDIIAKLTSVISSIDSENVDLQAKIQSLINSLPDSPANEDIIAKLDSIKSSVDTTDSDITTKLQAVISALPDSPANEDIIAKLQTIVNSVDNVTNSFNSDTIPHIILQIEGFEADTAYATIVNSLTLVKNALVGLRDGFDIDELADTITTLNSNRATIRNFDSDFGEIIDNLYLFLVRAATSPELKKPTTGALFENRIYRDETVHSLLNMKGNKHLILTLSGSNVNPPFALTETFTPTLPAYITYRKRELVDTTATYQSGVGHSNFVRSNNYRYFNLTALRRQYIQIDYIRTLRDVVRPGDTALSTKTLVSYTDKIIVIDGLTSSLKVVTFSYDVYKLHGSFEHLLWLYIAKSILHTSTRTKTGFTIPSGWRRDYTFSAWSAYTSVESRIYDLINVALHYDIEYHIEGSDTLNFAVVDNLGILPDSSGEKTVTTTRRYIRIRRRIVPTVLGYHSMGYVKPLNHVGYDVITNPNASGSKFKFDYKHDFAYDSLPVTHGSPLNYEVHSDPITLDNFIDSQTQGGTSYLSFEILDNFGNWHEYIPANTIGSITQGSRKTVTFGEAVSNHLLPSSQNLFRASLKTIGSLKTGASIIRIA